MTENDVIFYFNLTIFFISPIIICNTWRLRMGSATYDTISEDELIKKYNSFIVPCEESKSILLFL